MGSRIHFTSLTHTFHFDWKKASFFLCVYVWICLCRYVFVCEHIFMYMNVYVCLHIMHTRVYIDNFIYQWEKICGWHKAIYMLWKWKRKFNILANLHRTHIHKCSPSWKAKKKRYFPASNGLIIAIVGNNANEKKIKRGIFIHCPLRAAYT